MPITALPTDVLSLVLAQLCLVGNIKGVKRTCRAFRDAAAEAEKAHRRVCFEHAGTVHCVAVTPDGRVSPVCGEGEPGSGREHLNRPAAVLVHDGRLWIADLDNHRISSLALKKSPPQAS